MLRSNTAMYSLVNALAVSLTLFPALVKGAKTRDDFITTLPNGKTCAEGYVMDKYCIETLGYLLDKGRSFPTLETAEQHSYHCLLDVGVCINSGYEILSYTRDCEGDLYCRLVTLDQNGQNLVSTQAKSEGACSKCDDGYSSGERQGVTATVVGTIETNPTDDPPILQVTDVYPSSTTCADLASSLAETPQPTTQPVEQPTGGGYANPTPWPTSSPTSKPTLPPTSSPPTPPPTSSGDDVIMEEDDLSCSGYTHRVNLNENYQVSYRVTVDDPDNFQTTELPNGDMTVELVLAKDAGWLGFGIPHTGGRMVTSDVVIGLPPNTNPQQYEVTEKSEPGVSVATSYNQELSDTSISQNATHTTMTFKMRLVQEGRTGSIDVNAGGPKTFIWAYGFSNELMFHEAFGNSGLNLQVCVPGVGLIEPPKVEPTISPVAGGNNKDDNVIIPDGDVSCTGLTHRFDLNENLQLSYKVTVDDPSNFQNTDLPNGDMTVELVLARGFGWLGFGIPHAGTSMVPSDAVVGLPPNTNPQQYELSSRSQAGVNPATSYDQELSDTSISQNETHTTMTFTMRLVQEGRIGNIDANGPNTFIWAYGSGNQLSFHEAYNNFGVTLQVCVPGVGLIGEAADIIEGEAVESKRSFFEVHGILNTIAWGLITPLAISSSLLRNLFIRWTGSIKLWFYCHMGLNMLSLVLTIVAFAIAVAGVSQSTAGNATHFTQNTPHTMAGLIIFILVIVQVVNGILRPHLPPSSSQPPESESEASPAEEDASTNDHYNHDSGMMKTKSRAHSVGLQGLQSAADAVQADEEADGRVDTNPSAEEGKSVLRKVWEISHRILGIGLLVVSWWQIYTGWDIYSSMFSEDSKINILWGFIGGVIGLLVLLKIVEVVTKKKK